MNKHLHTSLQEKKKDNFSQTLRFKRESIGEEEAFTITSFISYCNFAPQELTSIERRKTKTKVITTANQRKGTYYLLLLMRIKSMSKQLAQSAGKRV